MKIERIYHMSRILLISISFIVFSFTSEEPLCVRSKLYAKADFPVGTALNTDKLKYEEKYWTTALGEFNSFTPEMIMKPQFLHPRKDAYNFSEIDHLTDFCKQYKIRLHGHTLVWYKGLPAWMENYKGTPAEWEAMLKDHIQTIIRHCSGSVKSWDVVNEAFNDDGSLRKNIWLKNIGESYIEKAFRYAGEADPSVLLFYNDYSLEAYGPKLKAVLKLLEDLRQKGVKIDGIGMQMHVRLDYPAIEEINGAALRIEQAGFLVHYSELDVSLHEERLFASGKKLQQLQRTRMKEIVKGYLRLNPKSRFGITMWGVSDSDSWLSEDHHRARPLLFDGSYKIKPAYCGFLEGLEK